MRIVPTKIMKSYKLNDAIAARNAITESAKFLRVDMNRKGCTWIEDVTFICPAPNAGDVGRWLVNWERDSLAEPQPEVESAEREKCANDAMIFDFIEENMKGQKSFDIWWCGEEHAKPNILPHISFETKRNFLQKNAVVSFSWNLLQLQMRQQQQEYK